MQFTPYKRTLALNPLDLIIAATGAVLMLVSAFLPLWETSTFSEIQKNTLVQSGDGIFLIVTAVIVAFTLYRSFERGRVSWWLAWQGVWALGWVIYDALHKANNTLYPYFNGRPDTSTPIHATPGIGMWVAGVGAALVLFAGLHAKFYGDELELEPEPVAIPQDDGLGAWDGVEVNSAELDRITRRALKQAGRLPGETDRDYFRRRMG
jgi:hypothetical protein